MTNKEHSTETAAPAAEVRSPPLTPQGRMIGSTFVALDGKHCPGCASPNVNRATPTPVPFGLNVAASCYDCKAKWTILFRIVGYDRFTEAPKEVTNAG